MDNYINRDQAFLPPTLRFKDEDGKVFPDWEEKKLKQLTKYYDGTHQTPKYVSSGIPFYSVEHVTANQFVKTKYIARNVFEKENKRVKLEKGDILMTRIGNIGTVKYIDWDVNASFYVSLALIKQNQYFNSRYLAHFMSSEKFQKELWKRTIHVAFPKKINLGEIGFCKVSLPSNSEQKKIANFLTVIGQRLQALTKKKTLLEQYKKGILQKVFNGQWIVDNGERTFLSPTLRFKDEDRKVFPDWEENRLGNYFTERKEKGNNTNPLYSLTIEDGIIPKSKRYEREFLIDNVKDAYKTMHNNDFAFNPMNLRFGALKQYEGEILINVSKYYNIFFCKKNANAKFFDYFLTSYNMIQYYNKMATGTLEEKKRVHYLEFIKFKIILPSLSEQTKIANFLSALDKKIAFANQQIAQIKTYKKGLLQKMFA